jgi:predicted transposase YbfD/YdcC
MGLSLEFLGHFEDLLDPRVDNANRRHDMMDIIALTLLAVICGADTWTDVEDFGVAKYDWLITFLPLANGIPSHDTIGRFFSALDSEELEASFMSWMSCIAELTHGDIISIDGKTARASKDVPKNKRGLHMLSAWSTANGLCFGQRKVDGKTNEITEIPKLLKMLDIEGTIVTFDAMGTQKKIAKQIRHQGADYLLAVKGNQGKLHDKLKDLFNQAEALDYQNMVYDRHETLDNDHGRMERRVVTTFHVMYAFGFKEKWQDLQSLIKVDYYNETDEENVTHQTRYYISSLAAEAERLGIAIRSHWNVENQLHWCLDVAFNEDRCRIRTGNASQNIAILRRLALNLLKKETTTKRSLRLKRKAAGWDQEYLFKILDLAKK